jgi:hypothetical protein
MYLFGGLVEGVMSLNDGGGGRLGIGYWGFLANGDLFY